MTNPDLPVYEFGPFRLDPANGLFRSDGVEVHLHPQAFRALLKLIERSPNLLTSNELEGAVWPDGVAGDYYGVISELRRILDRDLTSALGRPPNDDTYIQNVARRGYRFVAPVTVHRPSSDRAGSTSEQTGRPTPVLDRHVAEAYILPQQQALERWTLFDFHRDVVMTDVYVQEVLQNVAISPLGSVHRPAPTHESELFRCVGGAVTGEDHVYIITGRAGSGKTTMLRNWALRLLTGLEQAPSDELAPVPIYLSLRHLSVSSDTGSTGEITPTDLARCFRMTVPAVDTNPSELPFWRIHTLARSRFAFWRRWPLPSRKTFPEWILICDGFDEMAPVLRPALLHWLQALPLPVRVVVATRPGVLSETGRPPRSRVYDVCDFNNDQIRLFVTQWFKHDTKLGDEFLEQLAANERLQKLATIPLLLTCLTMDVEVRCSALFPLNLMETDLLRRAVEILLDRWDAIKSNRSVNHTLIRLGTEVLTDLALGSAYGSQFDYGEVTARVAIRAREMGVASTVAEEFLRRVTNAGRLLIGRPECGFSFGHPVLFDFFFSEGARRLLEKRAAQGNSPNGSSA